MKRNLLSIALCFFVFVSYSQLNLQVTQIKGSTVIQPSFDNLIKLVNSNYYDYKAEMKINNYLLTTDGNGYCANALSFTYLIQKETASILMAFANDDYGLVSNLRKEIKTKYTNVVPSRENGFEVYRIKLLDGTKIKFALQEQGDGFANVSVFLM
jgi:hypothetical protein